MAREWTDMLVGARMRVDGEFSTQVDNSQFSRQEWSLLMTAVEFEVEHADDPEQARLVADTSKVSDVMPEVQRAANMQGMHGPYSGQGTPGTGRSIGGGLLESVRNVLGIGGGRGSAPAVDQAKVSAAVSLVDRYATDLQTHLERENRWEDVRRAAGGESEGSEGAEDEA